MSDSVWIDRAQSAEAKLKTYMDQTDRMKESIRNVCETLGCKIKSDGSIDVDFDAFVDRLGVENALFVRGIIDEKYGISGEPGEKPKIRVSAA